MGVIKKRKKIGQYRPKEHNEIKLSSYIRKQKYELGENIRNN
jgi:hypothetical protein